MTEYGQTTRRSVIAGLGAGVAGLSFVPALRTASGADGRRIVSVGGSVTETLYLLDRGSWIVGADTTSSHPKEETSTLPKVGYMRALSAEGILSLRPDLVIADNGSGPPDALEMIEKAGVPVHMVKEARSVDDVVGKVRRIAKLTDAVERGRKLADAISQRAECVAEAVGARSETPSVLFLMNLREGALLAAGEGTAAEAIIGLAGGRNALSGFDGYKPVSAEAVLARNPDYLLMMKHAAARHGGIKALQADPRLSGLPAVKAGRLLSMDGLKLLGFGPRTPDAMGELAAMIHPDLDVPRFEAPLETL